MKMKAVDFCSVALLNLKCFLVVIFVLRFSCSSSVCVTKGEWKEKEATCRIPELWDELLCSLF